MESIVSIGVGLGLALLLGIYVAKRLLDAVQFARRGELGEAVHASGVLDSDNVNALRATLDQALTAITSDRPSSANLLNAFIHQVEGFIAGGSLTEEEGQALIDSAQDAIDLLNGS